MNDKKWNITIFIAIAVALLFYFVIHDNVILQIILGSIAFSVVLSTALDVEEHPGVYVSSLKKILKKGALNILIAIPVVSITVFIAHYLAA